MDILENAINPIIIEAVENQLDREGTSLFDEAGVHFQQDVTPPSYYVLPIRQCLDNEFLDKWIGRRALLDGQLDCQG